MGAPKEVRELAAEITLSLISITPGMSHLSKLLPEKTKKAVRAAYGVEKADTLEKAVEQTLEVVTADILGEIKAEPGTHEYGAPYSAITDFHEALKATRLDGRLQRLHSPR